MTTPELMTRLGKLIPLLASDKPGEVTATAAAITRALKGAGLDWHDVSKWVENGPQRPHQSSNSRRDSWNKSNSEDEQRRQRQERQKREREEAQGFNQYDSRQYESNRSSYKRPEEPPDWKPSLNSAQYQGLAKRILAADTTYLSAMELEFLKNATEWNSWATFKQENWIRKIAAKMRITV